MVQSRTPRKPAGAGRAEWGTTGEQLTENTFALLDLLRQIAQEQDVPVSAVAIAWVRRRPEVTSTINGCRDLAQLHSNLVSLSVELSDAQVSALGALTAPELPFPLGFLETSGVNLAQAGTTVNGVPSRPFREG
ncbi:aldo/keto reductase [Streptomyces sp. NPDC094472]|uniref:aldo/keto reductase n=1 Tax=unclassified Streptomyces TaxID=2593676 RepID=UPI0033202B52